MASKLEKSLYTSEHRIVTELLREIRLEAGLTQIQLAESLEQSQSFVSKYERGDRRLDIVQLRTVCQAVGITLAEFVTRMEKGITAKRRNKRQR